MSKRTLIKNGTIVTVDPAIGDLAKGDLLIEDGRIAQVASFDSPAGFAMTASLDPE